MILSLRQRYRHIFAVLGILLPVAFVAGITARPSLPVVKELPPELASGNQAWPVIWKHSDLFGKVPVSVQFLQPGDKTGAGSIRLIAGKDFLKPDLLVYWVPENSTVADSLPADAMLLGPFESSGLRLDNLMAKTSGKLVLFSLADGEIVDLSKPVILNSSSH